MADYIKRNDLFVLSRDYSRQGGWEEAVPVRAISNIPSADVQPVVHGEWKLNEFNVVECSVCHKFIGIGIFTDAYNFCPNCGADMRKDGGT